MNNETKTVEFETYPPMFSDYENYIESDIAEDDGQEYFIDILHEDKPAMREIIDKQFRERYNKSIEDLLKDSKDMMEIEHCACEAYLF